MLDKMQAGSEQAGRKDKVQDHETRVRGVHTQLGRRAGRAPWQEPFCSMSLEGGEW